MITATSRALGMYEIHQRPNVFTLVFEGDVETLQPSPCKSMGYRRVFVGYKRVLRGSSGLRPSLQFVLKHVPADTKTIYAQRYSSLLRHDDTE